MTEQNVPSQNKATTHAIDVIKDIANKALEKVHPKQRLTVHFISVLAIIALILTIAFIGAQQFIIAIILALACVLLMFVAYKVTSTIDLTPSDILEASTNQHNGVLWSRLVTRLPIVPDTTLGDLQLKIRDIRTCAHECINRSREEEIPIDAIRTNVFLPDTQNVKDGDVCGLYIPSQMHDNMGSFSDRRIRFRPHEGLTGRTFTLGEAGGAAAMTNDAQELVWSRIDIFPSRPSSDDWDRFTLSDEQKQLINKDIKWILSFPLKFTPSDKKTTFGVLNIDCLTESSIDEICQLGLAMEQHIESLSQRIAELPKSQISISLINVSNQAKVS